MNFENLSGKKKFFLPMQSSPSAPSVFTGLEEGEIFKLYKNNSGKYRADIRLFSGGLLYRVRLPGPSYSSQGFQHGLKPSYVEGLRVVVGFLNNRKDSPIVLTTFSHPSNTKNKSSLNSDSDYSPSEVSIGHKSGHTIVLGDNKVRFYDNKNFVRTEIDYTKGTVKIDFDTTKIEISKTKIELKSGTDKPEKTLRGEKTKDILEELIQTILGLTVMTPVGPSSPVSALPQNSAKLNVIKKKLPNILSKTIKNS